jgi:hypothetical protein
VTASWPRDGGSDPGILKPAEVEAADLRQAARRLVVKLRAEQPVIAFNMATRGATYDGPAYATEMAELERLLGPR